MIRQKGYAFIAFIILLVSFQNCSLIQDSIARSPAKESMDPTSTPTTNMADVSLAAKIFFPQDYGANCDGHTDDSTALTKWAEAIIDASNRTGFGVGYLNSICATTRPINFRKFKNRISILGQNDNSGFGILPNFEGQRGLSIEGQGFSPSSTFIIKNVDAFEHFIHVKDASIFSVNSFILLRSSRLDDEDPEPHYDRRLLTKVLGIDGNRLTLQHKIPFPILVDQAKTHVQSVGLTTHRVALQSIKIVNLGFQLKDKDQPFSGFWLRFLENPYIRDISTSNLAGTGPKTFLSLTYNGFVSGISDVSSTSCISPPCSGSAVNIDSSTGLHIDSISTKDSHARGIMLSSLNWSKAKTLSVLDAHGRGLGLYGSSQNVIEQVQVENSDNRFKTGTGISIAYGSCFNKLSDVKSINNVNAGIWMGGYENLNNLFDRVEAHSGPENITGADIYIGKSDFGTKLLNVDPRARNPHLQADTILTFSSLR